MAESHGRSMHDECCACVRCRGFEPGNFVALRHGATSERQIRPLARAHRRRVLRQLRISPRDLDAIGRAYLDGYVRLLAKVETIDRFIEREGMIRENGEPQPVMRLYVSLSNAARLTLARLEDHLRETRFGPDPLEVLIGEGRRIIERRGALSGGET